MELISYPADYSSAHKENYFLFEGVDVATPTEICFYDGAGELLGARRYVARESILSSPRTFVERLLSPEPILSERLECCTPKGREAALAVGYNNDTDRSPVIHFTASHSDVPLRAMMGQGAHRRTISLGECDEVAFRAAEGDNLVVTATLNNKVGIHIIHNSTLPQGGINVLIVNPAHIIAKLQPREEVEAIHLTLSVGGQKLGTLHYTIIPAVKGSTRLAWLNRDGYISYHTFRKTEQEELKTSRSECETPSGTLTLGGESWRERRLYSGYLSAEQEEQLLGIVTSPRVWMITPEGAVPQAILSHSVATQGKGAHTLELTIRPSRKERF